MNLAECVALNLCCYEALEPGASWQISSAAAQHLIDARGYEPSLGTPWLAEHYRRELPDGSGLHLKKDDGIWSLHRDRIHPGDPISTALHCLVDAPLQTCATVVGVIGAGLVLKALLR